MGSFHETVTRNHRAGIWERTFYIRRPSAILVGVFIRLPMATELPMRDRGLRYVTDFEQLSDKPLLASIDSCGVSKRIAQWRIEKLRADPI